MKEINRYFSFTRSVKIFYWAAVSIFLVKSEPALAQKDSAGLMQAIHRLDEALVGKKTGELAVLLHPGICFGHSNGWMQTGSELSSDLLSGKLIYLELKEDSIRILALTNKIATVRTVCSARGSLDGRDFNLRLYVMQVWLPRKKGWRLYARQSTRAN